ncbi:MAG TPA: M1 family aminopeptidase, partial [Bacteroidota bacterium]
QKGALVLHMLRNEMGDEKFFAGIREYYRTYRNGTALTHDLQRIMEQHAGRPLGWFFQQWIFRSGHPIIEATWKWNPGAKTVTLRLNQTHAGDVFQVPLEVTLTVSSSVKQEIVRMTQKQQSFTFSLNAKPSLVSIDPDEWMLKELTLSEER